MSRSKIDRRNSGQLCSPLFFPPGQTGRVPVIERTRRFRQAWHSIHGDDDAMGGRYSPPNPGRGAGVAVYPSPSVQCAVPGRVRAVAVVGICLCGLERRGLALLVLSLLAGLARPRQALAAHQARIGRPRPLNNTFFRRSTTASTAHPVQPTAVRHFFRDRFLCQGFVCYSHHYFNYLFSTFFLATIASRVRLPRQPRLTFWNPSRSAPPPSAPHSTFPVLLF